MAAALVPASASSAPSADSVAPNEASRIPFAERYHAVQHGGIVRAANSAISCRATGVTLAVASACTSARGGGAAANDQFDMFYADMDKDPNTYNSTRAELRVPTGATVSHARLYWGGNLSVGEQKSPNDNGRVLIAEPGGQYKELLSDTLIGHRTAGGADAYQASADVTPLVRSSGSGLYTVAQINVARGRSAAGAWGGWTLVVAYEKAEEPLRHLAIWDGFEALGTGHEELRVGLGELRTPAGAAGRIGVVSYDGDRAATGDGLSVGTDRGKPHPLTDKANSADDVMNSTIADIGSAPIERQPSYENNLGYDSDVFDLRGALVSGGDTMNATFRTGRDSVWLGALFVAVQARR